jgi:molybdopterin synthase catalytic subunit
MKRSLLIHLNPIDEAVLLRGREPSSAAGAAVYFLGIVRGSENGAPIRALEYEVFQAMAEHQFSLLFDEIEKRWPIDSIRVVHRVGRVDAGCASLWVEVLSAHRAEAFAACEFLIDEMKRVVPIWKRAMI